MSTASGFFIPKTKTSMSIVALLLVSLGAGSALLFDRWDEISNDVLSQLHIRHYRRAAMLKQRTEPVTITGEVVDAWCYASQTMGPGRGAGHLSCALACISGGVSAGILEDDTNTLYVAAKYKGYRGCRELLLPYIGKRVTVTGLVGDLGGGNILKIYSVKLAAAKGVAAKLAGSEAVETTAPAATEPGQTGTASTGSDTETDTGTGIGTSPDTGTSTGTGIGKTPGTAGDAAAAGQASNNDCTECAK